MKQVTLIGRYRVYKHRSRWIVTSPYAHGDKSKSTHGSYQTAVAAAKRYDEADRRRAHAYSDLVRRFV